jgi:hypothetical protein
MYRLLLETRLNDLLRTQQLKLSCWRPMPCNTDELKAYKSSDTLELKPLYLGAKEYQRLMDELKKKKIDMAGNNYGA